MKKLLLMVCLCSIVGIYASDGVIENPFAKCRSLTKRDLEKAICDIDLAAAKEIVAVERFTQREYEKYLDLAEEVVRNREGIVRSWWINGDITTPYDGPSEGRVLLEIYFGLIGTVFSGVFSFAPGMIAHKFKKYWYVGLGVSVALLALSVRDKRNMDRARAERSEHIRKKYDDAVAIKQAIYSMDLIEDEKKA